MGLIRNASGISRLLLIVLLLVAFVLGAFLSYVWTMSYYAPMEFQLPSSSTVTIESVQFSPQNASRFNVTILNPSFSPSSVSVNRIAVLTAGEVVHDPSAVSPSLPRPLELGESQTFDCEWDWANYTGQVVDVLAWVEDGSGATLKVETPFVGLVISNLEFDPSNTSSFSVTVQNNETSQTFVSVNEMFLTMENGTTVKVLEVSPPYVLQPNASALFVGSWNWTHYRNQTVRVTVHTVQGFVVQSVPEITPPPIIFERVEVDFNPLNTTRFNMTIQNSPFSLSPANITRITITLQNGTIIEITSVEPPLPIELAQNESVVFTCAFGWVNYPDMDVTVTAYTTEGFKAAVSAKIPRP